MYRTILRRRGYLIAAAYLLLFALSYEIAFQLRFDLNVTPDMRRLFWLTLPWTAAIKLVAFYSQGSFHGWWRFVTFADLVTLLRGAVLATLLIVGVDHFLITNEQIPRAALAIDLGVTILLVGGLRSVWRFFVEHGWQGLGGRRPVLMVGGDQWSEAMVRQIHRSATLDYRVIGFGREPAASRFAVGGNSVSWLSRAGSALCHQVPGQGHPGHRQQPER